MEVPTSEKENNSVRSGDEALGSLSTLAAGNEQNQVDQQVDSTYINQPLKSFEKNGTEPSLEDIADGAKILREDEPHLCHVYLSKLDISIDLSEPDLLSKCKDLIVEEQNITYHERDSQILYIEDFETKVASDGLLNYALFGSNDDSLFQKSMSLYKRQKEHFQDKDAEKLNPLSDFLPNSDQENVNMVDDEPEKPPPVDYMQGVEDALPNFHIEADSKHSMENDKEHEQIDLLGTEKSQDLVSASEDIELEVNPVLDLGPDVKEEEIPLAAEGVEGSTDPLPSSEIKDLPEDSGGIKNIEEVKLVDSKCDPLLNSTYMFSEASETLSRIHHSPESTH